jgi:predicted methyltransferase
MDFLRAEIEATGFTLAAAANSLRNPTGPRGRNTPDPPRPRDEFVLKFVRP